MTKKAGDNRPKVKERRLRVLKPASEVMVGDEIVVTCSREGYVDKAYRISRLETGESCRNLHVNDTQCWDRAVPIPIAMPEDEALAYVVGNTKQFGMEAV